MSLRVDLMRESEYRYQGPVSRKFATLSVGGVVLAALLLWLAIMIQHGAALNRERAQLEGEWNNIEPRFKAIKQKRVGLVACQGMMKELKPWSDTRVDWAGRLDELNKMVPPSIQITHLSMRAEWVIIKLPAPPVEDPNAPAKPAPPAIPARRFYLSISGRAAGDAGGDDAVQMVNRLKNSGGYGSVFEIVKLQHLLRDTQPNDIADRSFSIEGLAAPRRLE